jgi:hypothetical protein
MIDDKIFERILYLTNEKIKLDAKYKTDRNMLKNMSYSDRTRTRLAKRLIKQEQMLVHCENNLKLNQYMLSAFK